MDEIQKIQQVMEDIHDSSQWYHERSKEQCTFDDIVVTQLKRGVNIEAAMKKAVSQMTAMETFVTSKSIPELKKYYEQVRRLGMEIAIADNMLTLAAMRKRRGE